ncbi:similar to Saccharomyces cerevisiae YCR075W-A Putative protein of unknown function [Maudiozyma saulgeensis]|uniref:Uncharacterized protein n=1 Tax=Maudiozyma saulgeensis TaxID=1789683 RepID=A0A1X7R7E5_9SACH|nr:similar to Saccharomyces cerevisiae YCR075W-A Putative protein of unknown function [Kazachstania saulgeensis]
MNAMADMHLNDTSSKRWKELLPHSIGRQSVDKNLHTTYAEGVAEKFPKEFQKTHIEDLLHFTANELGKTGYAIKDDGDKIAHLFSGKNGAVHVLFTPKGAAETIV